MRRYSDHMTASEDDFWLTLKRSGWRLVVSLYNEFVSGRPRLLLIAPDSGGIKSISFTMPVDADRCMGLAQQGDKLRVIVAAKDDRSYLMNLVLPEMRAYPCHVLPGVWDGHSVIPDGSRAIMVVSSGTDEVVRFEIEDEMPLSRTVVWAASASGRDTHHLNSIARLGNSILISAFGSTPTGSWADSSNGYVYDITNGQVIIDGLLQPHSVSVHGGRVYYCDSRRGSFSALDGILAELGAYARGVCWVSETLACVGTSAGRTPSGRDRGDQRSCALWFVDVAEKALRGSISLADFGSEIYDVLAI